jgi:hypothetical protein
MEPGPNKGPGRNLGSMSQFILTINVRDCRQGLSLLEDVLNIQGLAPYNSAKGVLGVEPFSRTGPDWSQANFALCRAD